MSFLRRKEKTPGQISKLVGALNAPAFPGLIMQVLERLREPEVDMASVTEALQWDPGLVAQILRTVNSAAYGPATEIVSVRHAVSYMGREALEQVVTLLAVKDALPATPAPGFDPAVFWFHAGTRAALARQLSELLHPAQSSEVFSAGLLSDLAVPLLAHSRLGAYSSVLRAWNGDRRVCFATLERETFGWDHADVGAELARSWGLPKALVHGIAAHHSEVDDKVLAPALRLAGLLQDTESEHGLDALIETAKSEYGVTPEWMTAALESSKRQAGELLRSL